MGGADQRVPAGEPDRDVGGSALPPGRAQPGGLRRDQPQARRREHGRDLLLRGLLPGDRAPGRARHRPHPALRGRGGPGRRAHPRGAGGVHPVLGALLAADLRPLGEVQHPAGGDGGLRADLPAPRHRAPGGEPARAPEAPPRGRPGRLRERVVCVSSRGGLRRPPRTPRPSRRSESVARGRQ